MKNTTNELHENELNKVVAAGIAGTAYKIYSKTIPLLDEKLGEPERKYRFDRDRHLRRSDFYKKMLAFSRWNSQAIS